MLSSILFNVRGPRSGKMPRSHEVIGAEGRQLRGLHTWIWRERYALEKQLKPQPCLGKPPVAVIGVEP